MSPEITERECTQCLVVKPAASFYWKDGKRRLSSRCRECKARNHKENPARNCERSRDYYKANREAVLGRDKAARRANIAPELIGGAKRRAKRYGLPFDVTLADITVPDVCPVLGIALAVNDGRCGPNSPTLDRIVPALGYVKGNVIVISHRANTMKSDATLDELRLLLAYLERAYAERTAWANREAA